MTTIAFDGQVLAADRQTTAGGTPYPTTKVFDATGPDGRRWMWATSGNAAEGQEFTRCVLERRPHPKFEDLYVIAICEEGRVWARHNAGPWERKEIAQWAGGSGADYALGAMAAGACAVEAVRIAMTLDVNTGFGLDWISMNGSRGRLEV